MADNVAITAGSGTSIATDDCGAGGHAQIVKLAISTDGSATPIPADATLGLRTSRAADSLPTGTVLQNAATSTGNGTAMNVVGFASVLLIGSTTGGNYVANIELSTDNTNWYAVSGYSLNPLSETGVVSSSIPITRVNVGGAAYLRARTSFIASGAVTVTGYPSQVPLTDGSAYIKGGNVTGYGLDVVTKGSLVSTNNSSIVTLGSGGVFTGPADDVIDHAMVTVYVLANVASATDGLSIQQSNDGTNWDHADVYTIAAGIGRVYSIGCAARYVRVVYTNGGSAQGSFRLQTILHKAAQKPSSIRPSDARTNESDMEETLAYQMVFNGTTWDRVRGDVTNGMDVDVTRIGGTVAAGGDTAHAATNAGNPGHVGMQAIAHGTNPTAVTAGQRTRLYANRAGIPFVVGGHPNVVTVRLNFTAAQTDTAVITVAAGLKIVVTSFMFTLDNASTVFPKVTLGFGTANTPTTTGVIGAHGGVAAGGGFARGDGSGIIGIGADNEDLRLTTVGVATGNGMDLVVTYYTVES